MSKQRSYKRKTLNFSVNRGMQLRMVGKMTCILFVSLLISCGVYYHFANQQISASFQLFHVQARNFLDFLLPAVVISFGVSVVAGTVASLFFPKHIAGPLYRIEQDVQRIVEGDLTVRINLRSGDEGCSVAKQINQLAELFRDTIATVQDSLHKVQGMDSDDAMTQEERQGIYDQLAKKISKFKVSYSQVCSDE